MATPSYEPGPAEIREVGIIRARSMTRLYGINSPQTLEVLTRAGREAEAAQERQEQRNTNTQETAA